MDLTLVQQIEVLQAEIELAEFGRSWYSRSPFYSDQLKHALQLKAYDNIIQDKQTKIKKLSKL